MAAISSNQKLIKGSHQFIKVSNLKKKTSHLTNWSSQCVSIEIQDTNDQSFLHNAALLPQFY